MIYPYDRRLKRLRQLLAPLPVTFQQMKRHTPGRTGAYSGKSSEGLLQPVDSFAVSHSCPGYLAQGY